jgi:hypothetical protein
MRSASLPHKAAFLNGGADGYRINPSGMRVPRFSFVVSMRGYTEYRGIDAGISGF